jgi:hypothetical protein
MYGQIVANKRLSYVQYVKVKKSLRRRPFCGKLYAASTRRAGPVGRHNINIGQYTVRTLDFGVK